MERYVLFVNTAADYLAYPLKSFVGIKYASVNTIDLYFEKAPISYKITLTINTGTGVRTARKLIEVFSKYSGSVITFDEEQGLFPCSDVTAISSFTKVVIK